MKGPQPHMQGLWAGGENKQDELFRREKNNKPCFRDEQVVEFLRS